MRKNCVISAVGKNSLHREWISEMSSFDLHLIVYDDSMERYKNDTLFIEQNKGYKFRLVYDYLLNHPQFIEVYDYFFIPDDDIRMDAANIDKLFTVMEEYALGIAQPALSDSYYTYEHTMKKKGALLRYTNFVEVMVPCFSREALKNTLFTFNENVSGWGIDFHWSELIGFTGKEMAVIDDLHCVHTRPVQSSNAHNFGELDAYILKYNLKREVREFGFIPLSERQSNDIGVQNWNPLYSQPEQQKHIEFCLARIAQNLQSNINKVTTPGLSEGRLGISVFFFNYYRLTGKRKYYDVALAVFESIYDSLSTITDDVSLSTGLSGVSWVVEYLAHNGYIEDDTDGVLAEICTVLDAKSPLNPPEKYLDGESLQSVVLQISIPELLGYGMHYLSRMKNSNYNPEQNANHLTEKFITYQIIIYLDSLEQSENIESVILDSANVKSSESVNDSLAAIVLYLCWLKKMNVGHSKIDSLLVKYTERVKQQLLNDNDRDFREQLIYAYALLQSAEVTDNTEWEQKAINIALKTIEYEVDHNIDNRTGIASMEIAHLYNRIYQSTKRTEFKEAVEDWIGQILKRGNEIDVIQELSIADQLGLQGGLAGLGLGLIATIADFEPKWDEVLLGSHFCSLRDKQESLCPMN